MPLQRSPGCAAPVIASLAAGPVFLLSLIAAFAYLTLPEPIALDASAAIGIPLMLVPATVVGFILAFVPNLLGAAAMAWMAESHEPARDPLAWVAAGALVGAGLAAMFTDVQSPGGFATILTSAVCARICRTQFDWEPQA